MCTPLTGVWARRCSTTAAGGQSRAAQFGGCILARALNGGGMVRRPRLWLWRVSRALLCSAIGTGARWPVARVGVTTDEPRAGFPPPFECSSMLHDCWQRGLVTGPGADCFFPVVLCHNLLSMSSPASFLYPRSFFWSRFSPPGLGYLFRSSPHVFTPGCLCTPATFCLGRLPPVAESGLDAPQMMADHPHPAPGPAYPYMRITSRVCLIPSFPGPCF